MGTSENTIQKKEKTSMSDYNRTSEVFDDIADEMSYQVENWELDGVDSLEQWLVYIEDYVNEAKHTLTRDEGDDAQEKARDAIRKVAALAAAALSQDGECDGECEEEVEEDVEEVDEDAPIYSCPECGVDLLLEGDELVPYEEEVEEDEPVEDAELVEEPQDV